MFVARLSTKGQRFSRAFVSSSPLASYKFLELNSQNSVLTVRMNRPELSNAFNEELIAEMVDAFSTVDYTANKAIVLTGNGKQFSAGVKWPQTTLTAKVLI